MEGDTGRAILTTTSLVPTVSGMRTGFRIVDKSKLARSHYRVNRIGQTAAVDELLMERVDITSARSRSDGVQVILRAVDILWALRACPEGQSLPQLARRLGLARPTVHRVVKTLASVGFVAQLPNGHIRLGSALSILGAAANTKISVELHPYLVALSRDINESVMLATLEGERLTCLDFIASPQSLQAVALTGMALPFHCTAIGKSILPELTELEFLNLIPEYPRRWTANTIGTREALWTETQRVREAGVALDREEYETGLCGLGASVSRPDGVRAAIGVLVPSVRFYGNEERLICELLKTRDLVRAALRG